MTNIKPGMKVRCIDDRSADPYLKRGQIYKVRDYMPEYSAVFVDDNPGGWSDTRFVVVGCSCNIKACVAKHDK